MAFTPILEILEGGKDDPYFLPSWLIDDIRAFDKSSAKATEWHMGKKNLGKVLKFVRYHPSCTVSDISEAVPEVSKRIVSLTLRKAWGEEQLIRSRCTSTRRCIFRWALPDHKNMVIRPGDWF